METVELDHAVPTDEPIVLAIGAFDGVHRLHRAVLAELRKTPDARSAKVGVLLIEGGVHFRAQMLTAIDHRVELLAETGHVDRIWTVPETFYHDPHGVVAHAMDVIRPVCAAFGWVFPLSTTRPLTEADFESLAAERGITALPLRPAIAGYGEVAEALYATHSIRDFLALGHMAIAARLLGRLYEMRGVVETGDQRGRLLGFPTANLPVHESLLLPEEGVYAGVALIDDEPFASAISLGRRPTFYEAGWKLLETHLLDFDGDLYGKSIRVLFTEHLRTQRHFSSVDELVGQLKVDVALVRELDPVGAFRTASRI
jgi:riboflavin kinase/FMN adenylyltransferase